MSADYSVFAPIYKQLKMDGFAQQIIPQLITYAQQNDWMGRRIIDLGCGLGSNLKWLSQRNYRIQCIDNSNEMLGQAQTTSTELEQSVVKWIQQDIRNLQGIDSSDLAMALSVMNEFESLRDYEAIFKGIHPLIGENGLFVFDVYTIEGLLNIYHNQSALQLEIQERLLVTQVPQFDYERQVLDQRYLIFNKQKDAWQKDETNLIRRAFPLQTITSLLQRCGFQIYSVLDINLQNYSPNQENVNRVIMIAKQAG